MPLCGQSAHHTSSTDLLLPGPCYLSLSTAPLHLLWGDGKLEGSVEVVLLLVGVVERWWYLTVKMKTRFTNDIIKWGESDDEQEGP